MDPAPGNNPSITPPEVSTHSIRATPPRSESSNFPLPRGLPATGHSKSLEELKANISELQQGSRVEIENLIDLLLANGAAPEQLLEDIEAIVNSGDPRFPRSSEEFSFPFPEICSHLKKRMNPEDAKVRLQAERLQSTSKGTSPQEAPNRFQKTANGEISDGESLERMEAYTQQSDSTPIDSKREKRLAKLKPVLVSLIDRKPCIFHIGIGEKEVELTQQVSSVSHKEDAPSLIPGKAPTSEALKTDKHITDVANNAHVIAKGKDGKKRVLLQRSARTINQKSIANKSISDIATRFETGEPELNGLKKKQDTAGKTYYEYQRTDVTFMDDSKLKAMVTRGKTHVKQAKTLLKTRSLTKAKQIVTEDEKRFLSKKYKAIDAMWSGPDAKTDTSGRAYIERKVKVGEETHTVREYKPLVLNYTFSGFAKSKTMLRNARKHNVQNNLELLRQVIQVKKSDANFYDLENQLNQLGSNPSPEDLEDLQARIRISIMQIQAQGALDRDKNTIPDSELSLDDQKLIMALRGLGIALTGEDRNGIKFEEPHHHSIDLLAAHAAADIIGMSFGVECKSGNDRTATGTALIIAQFDYQLNNGGVCDLSTFAETQGIAKSGPFKMIFEKQFDELGSHILRGSRGPYKENKEGLPEAKVATSPVFQFFSEQYIYKKLVPTSGR